MKRGVVDAAAELLGPERSRAGWFEYLEEKPPRLVPVPDLRRGRGDPQRTEFVAGTLEGDAALELLENDSTRFCGDVDLDPPPGWSIAEHSGYKTFISAGVVADGRKFGMLSLDALEAGDLTNNDVYAMSLLAKLLAAALAQV